MTASTMPSDTERCLSAGMDHFSGKPIRPNELDAVIDRALGRGEAPSLDGGSAPVPSP